MSTIISRVLAREDVEVGGARSFRERAVGASTRFGERLVRFLDAYFGRHSLVGNHTFFATADFPWIRDLEAHEATIRVGNDVRHWNEGASLVFDDTFEHEAWNDTDATRVVLFVDFKRPLGGAARVLNAVVLRAIGFSPFIQDAKARHGAWERRFEQVRNRVA